MSAPQAAAPAASTEITKDVRAEVWTRGGRQIGNLALDGGIVAAMDSRRKAGEDLMLQLYVRSHSKQGVRCFGIRIDEKTFQVTTIQPRHDRSDERDMGMYSRIMTVRQNDRHVTFVNPNDSLIRLVRIDGHGGCTMINYAVTSQGGKYFLTQQVMFAVQAYRDGDSIRIPELQRVPKWKELAAFLESAMLIFRKEGLPLPSISEYQKPAEEAFADGTVIWYSYHQQVGIVQTTQGRARIHWSSIPARKDDFKYVTEGEVVRYGKIVPRMATPGHVYSDDVKIEVKDVVIR